ncbi:POU domain, class 6, transcription factor 2 isoform X1 [Anopheles funestus]|uniref:POU domain, class 6, transcription factor 2 isoform X1 n=2 Tax=Anopheles funestus TaxID=62324 RepID=UPI0020C6E125|nr:POU domain, class 6, transcription factor 2 isoform X1 [Anopheles funestus]XP_049294002.1 POU domain, class 6, transcription factor 2 isoform X1 [Anopheles funestus]
MEDGGADPENNNSSHCGMLGISMPCEGAGHDFSTVRKELEYANAIAAHYGATEKGDRIISYKIENRRRSDHCSRSNSPFLTPTPTELDGRCSNSSNKTAGILRTAQDKMSPLSMPTGPSATSTTAAAAAAAVAAAQVHLNGTMQDMLNLQKLQSLAQLTGASVLGPSLGLPTSPLLGNSPLNLSLSGQNHSPQVLGLGPAAPIAAAAPQMPQLLLASGQIMQGIQGAQLLIPTSQGIATQTILTIPVGQQVISNMSSEALLQSLNFNNSLSETLNSQAAQAAAAAAAASGGLFATPRDTTGSTSSGLLSTQLLASAGGHPLQQSQQHSPKGLHYANHHHHHHHHHGDVKFKPNSTSASASSVSGSSCLPSVHDAHRQQHQSSHSLSSSAGSNSLGHGTGGRMTPDMHRTKVQSGESPKRISLATSSPPVSTLSRPASYASCSSSPYEKSMPLKRTLSPPATMNCTTPSSSSGSGHSSNGHLQVNVHSAIISATSPRSPSDSAINRLGLPSGSELITSKSKLSPAGSSSSGLALPKEQPSTHTHSSVSPLHHHSSSGPSAPGSTGRPGSCDLELIEQQQHHRAPSVDDLELDKPSTVGSSSGTVHQLQKRPHHSAASTPPPKLSPAGSAGRLSHSDDDDDDASNHEFLEEHPNELTINQTNCNVVDGIDLDDIKEFAKAFKLRRLSLGLTQTQVGQALSVTEGPAYSQSAICSALAAQMYCAAQLSSQQQQMFEKLDITPKSAQKIKPVLERWMKEAEESHSSRYKSGQNHVPDFIGVEPSKKRKRRTSFTPQALELLNGHFERNTHPSGTEITGLAHQLGYEREVIRIWFCNKRQALKNTVRMMSKSFKMENT